MPDKIRVLIVDDSPLVRETIRTMLESDPGVEVVGFAKDGREGVSKTESLKPDVITMDLKMPMMSGIEAIETIMSEQPTPIIVVSSLDINVIVTALGIGAMDFVPITENIDDIAKDLVEKVRIASRVRPMRRMPLKRNHTLTIARRTPKKEVSKVVAIGVSTGGPQALQVLFSKVPSDFPGAVIVVQHIAKGFIEGLVEWLKLTSHIDIKVARSGDILHSQTAYFAPDDLHMEVTDEGKILLSEDGGRKHAHVPSIDVMMKSLAASYGDAAVGVIMTGMGSDGVEGMKAIKNARGITIAQDQFSSVIFGMNKVAIECGCIDTVASLEQLADEIIKAVT